MADNNVWMCIAGFSLTTSTSTSNGPTVFTSNSPPFILTSSVNETSSVTMETRAKRGTTDNNTSVDKSSSP